MGSHSGAARRACSFVRRLARPLPHIAARAAGRQNRILPPAEKLRQLVFPFANYILPLDIVTACAVGTFLLGCLAKDRCRASPASVVALLLTALLFLAAPWAFKGTYFLDTRFVIMLGFLLFGALLPAGLPRTAALSAATAFTLLFGIRMAVVAFAWHGHGHDIAGLRRVIATVQPGTRVLVASVLPEEAPDYWQNVPLSRQLSQGIRLDRHLPALLLIERRAYWPFQFDNPSQQPMTTLPPYRELAERADLMPGYRALAVPAGSIFAALTNCCCWKRAASPTLRNSPRIDCGCWQVRTSPHCSASGRRPARC